MKLLVIILVLLIIVIIYFYFNNQLKQKFDKDSLLKELNKYDNIIICGNSPKFTESFKKIKNTDDAFIIRFNSVLEHLPKDSKTDVLFISSDVYNNYDKSKIRKWNKKCKVYLVDDLLIDQESFFMNYPHNLTSGLSVLLFLINYINPNKIILTGFDMVDNYDQQANWYGNTLWDGHNINVEKKLLNEIISKNNITKY